MNDSPAPVLALDVPSGLHSDTGRVLGGAVRAAATVSFIGLKQGLFTAQGRECAGEIVYRDLEVPDHVFARVEASARRMAYEDCLGLIGPRRRDAHKGRFGHVLVVGGDHGLAGAARLAGEAAARTGAGLVSVATRREHVAPIVASRPELMVRGIESPAVLGPLLDRASVIAVGPGLGRDEWGTSLLERVVASDRAIVIDADAINLLAQGAVSWPKAAARPVVYTPHPGEAARVLGVSVGTLESDRFAAARTLAETRPGTWLLKGAGTIVAESGLDPTRVRRRQPGNGERRDGRRADGHRRRPAGPGMQPARCCIGRRMRARGGGRRRGRQGRARHARERCGRGAACTRGSPLMASSKGRSDVESAADIVASCRRMPRRNASRVTVRRTPRAADVQQVPVANSMSASHSPESNRARLSPGCVRDRVGRTCVRACARSGAWATARGRRRNRRTGRNLGSRQDDVGACPPCVRWE